MVPEQIPGTLFVLLLAGVAFATGQYGAVILLAIGCAFGWVSMLRGVINHPYRAIAAYFAICFWAWALGVISWRIL